MLLILLRISAIYVKIEILKSEFIRLLQLTVFFIVVTPIIFIIVNKIIEYSILINTGAELNIIITNVTDRAGLTIKTRIKIKISLYSKHINRFLRIIKNILISIGLVIYRVNIFVTRSVFQSFILEIFYLYSARV